MKHLYLIGNGFDKHHDIPSGYWDYHEWLKEKGRKELVEQIDELYDYDKDLWSCFERELGNLDVKNKAQEIYSEHPADEMSDHYERTFHEAAIVAGDDIGTVYNQIKESFPDWVRDLPKGNSTKRIKIEKDAYFITFNYTDTLHDLYNVPFDNILYIHGRALVDRFLVLGHGKSEERVKQEAEDDFDEETESAYMQTVYAIEQQVAKMRKDTDGIIKKNQILWESLKEVEQIHVYGCSLDDVDKPYFEKVLASVNSDTVSWQIDVFGKTEEERQKALKNKIDFLMSIGVDASLITPCVLSELKEYKEGELFK